MADPFKEMRDRIVSLSDEELVEMFDTKSADHTPEAITIAKEEAARRGVLPTIRESEASTDAAGKEFRVGEVLVLGFAILFKNLAPFGLLALLFTAPTYIFAWALGQGPASGIIGAAVSVVDTLLSYVLTAALVYGTFQELRNRRAGLDDIVRRGLALMFPVVGVSIVVGLAVGIAFLAFIIPGIIVFTMLWVAVPAAVVERPGVFASLSRSVELTKGNRWRVFGIVVIIGIIGAVAGGIIQAIIGSAQLTGSLVGQLASLVFTAFISALNAVVSAVGYHDLRVIKEGVDVNEIAAVFD